MDAREGDPRLLVLLFAMGPDIYAVPASQALEILPLLATKALPGAPPYVRGLAATREGILPVIDLCLRATGAPARSRLSTRILVIAGREGSVSRRVGFIVESLTRAELLDLRSTEDPGVQQPDAPYLGRVANTARGIVQLVDIGKVVPDDVWEHLALRAEAAS